MIIKGFFNFKIYIKNKKLKFIKCIDLIIIFNNKI